MFILPFEVSKAPFQISIRDTVLLIGSCFTENIGDKLIKHKFNALTNPLGVIYNPISLFNSLRMALDAHLDQERIFEINQVYYHWDAHSAISDPSKKKLLMILEKQLKISQSFLKDASTLVISLGTSWVYRHRSSGQIVANCHKVPQKEFTKSLLAVEEITQNYSETIEVIRSVNPALNVVFTVSPVRHVRDGLIENNQSKGILIEAVRQIISDDPKASYFPSYEILIDVLRDYRFYKEDMIHPTDQAIDYIWAKFSRSYFDKETLNFIKQWEKLIKAMNHRPFHPETSAHQQFLVSTAETLKSLADIVDVKAELNAIKKQLLDS